MNKFFLCMLLLWGAAPFVQAQFADKKLIAHRGGIVNDSLEENSIESLKAAAEQGYYMVELDVRMTKDSILIAHHDADLKRYFGTDLKVADLTFHELQNFKSKNGNSIEKLETLLDLCAQKGLQVMVDLKLRGFHEQIFQQLVSELKKRNLQQKALIIPSSEATDFFRSKIKLSCSREQVEAYKLRADYDPSHYYLFANPSAEDFDWAQQEGIQAVGAINYRKSPESFYQDLANHLNKLGVKYIQLDSRFDKYFKN